MKMAEKTPTGTAKRPSSLLDRLSAPTTLMHELAAVGYATVAICLMLVGFAVMKH